LNGTSLRKTILLFAVSYAGIWPAQAQIQIATDPPEVSGKPVPIDLPGAGRIVIVPRQFKKGAANWCTAEIRGPGRFRQIVPTAGGVLGGSCWASLAVGRVPAPRGIVRLAVIYIANRPGEGLEIRPRETPVVLFRKTGQLQWRRDDALTIKLGRQAGVRTIGDLRTLLSRPGW